MESNGAGLRFIVLILALKRSYKYLIALKFAYEFLIE